MWTYLPSADLEGELIDRASRSEQFFDDKRAAGGAHDVQGQAIVAVPGQVNASERSHGAALGANFPPIEQGDQECLVGDANGQSFVDDLYRDNAFATSAWRGTDLATLAVAVPILIVALILALRGSLRAQLVWLGMLDYTLYDDRNRDPGTSVYRVSCVYRKVG